jgi:hypothetical protein|nr:MAG TPA: hypothetical protein [Caudoviricetes sp.]
MRHVKINEAIVHSIKSLDIPVDKVDTEKLLSVFMDLMSLTEDETTSNQDNDGKHTTIEEQETRLVARECRIRTSFDKANMICKGLVEDRRVYIEQFLSDLYSLFIDNLRGIGSIYLLNAEHNDTYVYHQHYVIEQREKGFINIEFDQHGEIDEVSIRYKNADVKVDLTTGIISFKFKLKRDHMSFNDTKEGIELFAINNRPFAHELANMVKLGL